MGFKPSTMGVKRIEWDDLATLEMGFHSIWLIKGHSEGQDEFSSPSTSRSQRLPAGSPAGLPPHRAAQRHHGDVGHWTHLPVGIWWRTALRSMVLNQDELWIMKLATSTYCNHIAHGYMLYNCKWLKKCVYIYIYQNMWFWGSKPVHAFAFLSLMFCSVFVCSFKTNVCGLTHTPLLLKLG